MATKNKKQTKKTQATKKTKKIAAKKATEKKIVKKTTTTVKKKISEKPIETVEKEIAATATQQPAKITGKAPAKRRIVVNYNQLAPELIELLNEQYPLGWRNFIIKVEKGNGDFFHAITLDTEDVSYLIKVPVKIDNEITDDVEKDLFGLIPDDEFMVDDEQDDEYDDKDDN
ncbi:MAG: hypothetical protein LBT56_07635 [Prevotellaceae bacterium]|jgi:hypothetical protein|nr:hypothetical protein [Prevotellaceae bacterium]